MRIKKINRVEGLGTFSGFTWPRDLPEFGKVNIIYGRNYAGKTTLSRLFCYLGSGQSPRHYDTCKFELEEGYQGQRGRALTEANAGETDRAICVFNSDYIRENLGFFFDPEAKNHSFTILGQQNLENEKKIQEIKERLSPSSGEDGLEVKRDEARRKLEEAKKDSDVAKRQLDRKLKAEAKRLKEQETAIFSTKLRSDTFEKELIGLQQGIPRLTEEEVVELRLRMKEEPKSRISLPSALPTDLDAQKGEVIEILGRTVSLSDPLERLADDREVREWVERGVTLHKKRDKRKCLFCESEIAHSVWEKILGHFDEESQKLKAQVNQLIQRLESSLSNLVSQEIPSLDLFYESQRSSIVGIRDDWNNFLQKARHQIEQLKKLLQQKAGDVTKVIKSPDLEPLEKIRSGIRDNLQDQINVANNRSAQFEEEMKACKERLKTHLLVVSSLDMGYSGLCDAVTNAERAMTDAKAEYQNLDEHVKQEQTMLLKLEASLGDETTAAEKINEYLQHYFGHQHLCLKAERVGGTCHFEIQRGGKTAYNLSEGEKSLIAFCYFTASLADVESNSDKPIIWIDDPISSLDNNHIFFIFSLFESEIYIAKRFTQLFVSTHNLNFLKYLKSIARDKELCFFLIERGIDASSIRRLPESLKNSGSEFTYLFGKLKACAECQNYPLEQRSEIQYGFASNARKFIEIYLNFKRPGASGMTKLLKNVFADDQLGGRVLNRIMNENAHLDAPFEKAMTHMDSAELEVAAKFLLAYVEESDPEQYKALCTAVDGENGGKK